MDLEFFKKKVKDTVKSFEFEGDTYYYRIPAYLDSDLFTIMKDKKRPQREKIIDVLLAVICNEDGFRVFNDQVPEHRKIVKALPNEVQVKLVEGAMDDLFPGK